MVNFKFLHLCDHTFKIDNSDGKVREIEVVHDADKLIDLVIDGAVLLSIMEVRVLEYNPVQKINLFSYDNDQVLQTYEDVDAADGFLDDSDGFTVDYSSYFTGIEAGQPSNPISTDYYEPFLHNRIKWNVSPPIKYVVKGVVLFNSGKTKVYAMEECPRCQGNGWFVDILNQNGTFEKATGLSKIAQTIVKDIMTKVGSNVLDNTYGTFLYQQSGNVGVDDTKLFDDLRLIVSEVEDNYLAKQAQNIETLNPDETLAALRVNNLYRPTPQSRKIMIELQIVTLASDGLFRIAF